MQISVQGASLLATLFPIGLLIVLVEARALTPVAGPSFSKGDGRQAYFRWLFSRRNNVETIHAVTLTTSLMSTVVCVVFVCMPAPINLGWSVYVAMSGGLMVLAVFIEGARLIALLEGRESPRE